MWKWAIVALLALLNCSNKNEVSPPLATCGGDGCHPESVVTVLPGTGGTSNVTDADSGVSLTINAVAFASSSSDSKAWSLSNVKNVTEPVKVQAFSVTGTVISSTGSSPIDLSGVATDSYAWVSASPTSTGSAYLPCIISIAHWSATNVSIPLLVADDFAFVSGLLTTTTLSLDSSRAQLALKIVDTSGNGVRNARVKDPGAVTVAYANSGAWINASLEPYTDASGRVVVVNLPAPTTPGTFATITAYGNNTSGVQITGTSMLPIVAGFVSYGTILLDLG